MGETECCVCREKESLVEITFKKPDGTKEVEFYCKKHGREEFQKAWKHAMRSG